METLRILAFLMSTLFDDQVSCTVQGYVLKMHDADAVAWTRVDTCTGVQVEEDGNALVLHSPAIWVTVIIPAEYGHRRFQYRWGAYWAHVGPETVPVVWGVIEKG